MTRNASEIEIIEIDRIEFKVEPWSWEFSHARRLEIDRFFADMQRQRSHLWNGRVMMLRSYEGRDRALRGVCFETDYASFTAWREWGFPGPAVFNVFADSALRGADGGFLV